jgi:hypothetical protein
MKSVYLGLLCVGIVAFMGACGNDSGTTTPTVDTVPPNPPVGLQIGPESGIFKISWTDNAEIDLAGYNVYVSSQETGPFKKLNDDLLLCNWCYDDPVPSARTYYKVTAVDESGNESTYSQLIGVYSSKPGRHGPVNPYE